MSYNIFMSGPVTNDPNAEFKFFNYENIIKGCMRELGYDDVFIWNPIDRIDHDLTHEQAMLTSLMWLCDPEPTGEDDYIVPMFDLMITLPGAGTSKGSRVEQTVAQAIGVPIMTVDEFVMADDLP